MTFLKVSASLGLLLCATAVLGTRFNPGQCLKNATEFNATHPDHSFFKIPPGAHVYRNSFIVTYAGCNALCGDSWAPYSLMDVLSSFATWVLPLILLIGNWNFGHCGLRSKLGEVAHLLGDPIDAIWSLLYKLECGQRNGNLLTLRLTDDKVQDISDYAAVFSAIDDFQDNLRTRERRQEMTMNAVMNNDTTKLVRDAGRELSGIRINNTLRSFLAILSYFFNMIGAYLKNRQEPHPADHRALTMAFRLLYFWLIPAVILSTVVGNWPSRDASLRCLKRLQETIHTSGQINLDDFDLHLPRLESWNGGNLSWLPDKYYEFNTCGRIFNCFIAVICVGSAFGTAFAVSWFTPTRGLGCGGLVLVGYFGVWILSFLFTCGAARWEKRKMLWRVIVLKDLIFAVPMLMILFAAYSGYWNSCKCWSAYFSLGASRAYLDLNIDARLDDRQKRLVPELFAPASAIQLVLVGLMLFMSRQTLKLNWSRVKAEREDQSQADESQANESRAEPKREGGGEV